MDPSNQNTSPKPATKSKQKGGLPLVVGVVVLLVIAVGIYAFVSNNKESSSTNTSQQSTPQATTADKTAQLSTDPAEAATQSGEVTTLSIWVDTGGQQVSAVQTNLTYPTDQYEFVDIDNTGSAFEIQAESKGGDGKIVIARGQLGGVNGKQLVAKVNLKAKNVTGSGNIAFTDESQVLTLSDSPQNILNKTSGATLTLGE